MTQNLNQTPKKRITSIDAIRGFALIGILFFHCMEQFDMMQVPVLESSFWQAIDTGIAKSLGFLFAGKSYAIFSLLFGLSFFMQMDSQADKGVDFRLRFLWRLALLFGLGYINGLVYMGEFFLVYAILGVFLVPLFKWPTKVLMAIAFLFFLQIPDIISFVSMLQNNVANTPRASDIYMAGLYDVAADVYMNGSFTDVIKFNSWDGQVAKLLWTFNNSRYLQLIGLFIAGMLIGRFGIHKSEELMVKYSRLVLPYSIAWAVLFYSVVLALPHIGIEGHALQVGTTLFMTYTNLGMMLMYLTGLTLLYYKTNMRKVLDIIAPMGRMSVTNYMAQSFIGVFLFYGFGANLAVELTYLQCFLVGAVVVTAQLIFSNWWMKNYYYGPLEWAWRTATWFKSVPLKRK